MTTTSEDTTTEDTASENTGSGVPAVPAPDADIAGSAQAATTEAGERDDVDGHGDPVGLDDPADGIPAPAGSALSRMVGELRATTWPTRSEFGRYTAVVLGFLVVTTAAVGGVDSGLSALILRIFG